MRKREKPRAAGASGKAPLLGERNANMSSLSRVEKDREVMEEVLGVCRMPKSASRTDGDHSQGVLGSADFQTCRMADSPKSAGREAALEVGLETWAATVRRRDLTHSLSLSLVASCHR
jgi:hypothetical protein